MARFYQSGPLKLAIPTVGISGKCDAKKAANETKKGVTNDVKDKVDIDKPMSDKGHDGRLKSPRKN